MSVARLMDNQGVPAGSAKITAASFTELGAAAGASCGVWAKAVAQASSHARVPVITCLIIAPPWQVLPLFLTNSATKAGLQYEKHRLEVLITCQWKLNHPATNGKADPLARHDQSDAGKRAGQARRGGKS